MLKEKEMPPEHEDGPACPLEESKGRAYRWGLSKKVKERRWSPGDSQAGRETQRWCPTGGRLPQRPAPQAEAPGQADQPPPTTNYFTQDPGAGKAQHQA